MGEISHSDTTSSRSLGLGYSCLARLRDEDLMEHLRAGHADALAVLFDRYHRLVLSVASRILRDPGEAEDVMQSVFLEILRSAARFEPGKGTAKVWILQYAYHRSLNRRSYLSRRGFYDRSMDLTPVQRISADSRSFGGPESAYLVQQALSRLTKGQRRTLELAFFEGLTMREIADRTGESFANVRHHYYRALERLRMLLCTPSETQNEATPSSRQVVDVKT